MADRLSALLQRLEPRTRVCHGGPLGGAANFDDRQHARHVHLLRQGSLEVTDKRSGTAVVERSVIFFPLPNFALCVGVPRGEYLTGWRLGLARHGAASKPGARQ